MTHPGKDRANLPRDERRGHMANPQILCVVPARGGSRGIPRKNLARVAGKALVAHAIEQALSAVSVSRVVVSTDDPEIAMIARRFGAETIMRPAELSNDRATSEDTLLHALDTLEEKDGYRPDLLVFLQCTAPLTVAADIDGTVQELLDQDADSALAVAPSHAFLWKRGAHSEAVAVNHDPSVRLRRQEREPEFVEAGSAYVMRVDGFRSARHRFFGKTVLHQVPRERLLEIDEGLDLEHAQVGMLERIRGQRIELLPDRPAALVLDFDGVMTDNTVVVDQDGRESVCCSRGDGLGIERLQKTGIPVMVLSKERNPVVTQRCAKLSVPCMQGLEDKASALTSWLSEQGMNPRDVVYLGNDVNDAGCLQAVGCGVVVSDAHRRVKVLARFVLDRAGGRGAVRELTDLIEARLGTGEPAT